MELDVFEQVVVQIMWLNWFVISHRVPNILIHRVPNILIHRVLNILIHRVPNVSIHRVPNILIRLVPDFDHHVISGGRSFESEQLTHCTVREKSWGARSQMSGWRRGNPPGLRRPRSTTSGRRQPPASSGGLEGATAVTVAADWLTVALVAVQRELMCRAPRMAHLQHPFSTCMLVLAVCRLIHIVLLLSQRRPLMTCACSMCSMGKFEKGLHRSMPVIKPSQLPEDPAERFDHVFSAALGHFEKVAPSDVYVSKVVDFTNKFMDQVDMMMVPQPPKSSTPTPEMTRTTTMETKFDISTPDGSDWEDIESLMDIDCQGRGPSKRSAEEPSPPPPTTRRAGSSTDAAQDDTGHETSSSTQQKIMFHENSDILDNSENRWMHLVATARWRRRWSAKSKARSYSRPGRMPRNLDGPARGFGWHLGRWQWRELRHFW